MQHPSLTIIGACALCMLAAPAAPQIAWQARGDSRNVSTTPAFDHQPANCSFPVGCITRIPPDDAPIDAGVAPSASCVGEGSSDTCVSGGAFVLQLHGVQTRLDQYLGVASGHEVFGSSNMQPSVRAWFRAATNEWVVDDESGVKYTFGEGEAHTRHCDGDTSPCETVEWGLSSVEDSNGNRVSVTAPAGVARGDAEATGDQPPARVPRADTTSATDRPPTVSSR